MLRPAPVQWLKAHPFGADAIFAGLIGVICVAVWTAATTTALQTQAGRYRSIDALGVVLIIAQVAPLAWRRRAPQLTLVVVLAATVIFYAANYLPVTGGTPALIATYSVAAHAERRLAVRALGGVILAVIACLAFSALHHPWSPAALVINGVFVAMAWILGDNLRTRRAYTAALEERATNLERDQQDNARRAVNQERARIARELHDVVAHSVSVMVVQAGAARRVLHRDADRATEALASIESTGRQALDELRRLLSMLREYGDGVPALTPQPTVEDLAALVTQFEEAGLDVDLTVEGNPQPLPSGADLSVFRIVQEALTNTLKHAGPARAVVRVSYQPGEVLITVSDDGRGLAEQLRRIDAKDAVPAQGHGLVGMRERVALFGGELRAAPRPGGGFEVRARLPLLPAGV
jgi:signal transduction histidine kinase